MTHIPVTLLRDALAVTVDLDTLSPADLDAWIATQPAGDGWCWVRQLVAWIQTHVHEVPPQKPPWLIPPGGPPGPPAGA